MFIKYIIIIIIKIFTIISQCSSTDTGNTKPYLVFQYFRWIFVTRSEALKLYFAEKTRTNAQYSLLYHRININMFFFCVQIKYIPAVTRKNRFRSFLKLWFDVKCLRRNCNNWVIQFYIIYYDCTYLFMYTCVYPSHKKKKRKTILWFLILLLLLISIIIIVLVVHRNNSLFNF